VEVVYRGKGYLKSEREKEEESEGGKRKAAI
jgi:hypothetical protein